MKLIIKTLLILGFVPILFSCQPEEESATSAYDVRNTIIGYWKVDETSSEYGNSKYTVKITVGNDSNEIFIDNFYNIGDDKQIKGIVYKDYLIDIKTQTVDGFIFQGNATINNSSNHITFSYTADDQGDIIDTISSSYTK